MATKRDQQVIAIEEHYFDPELTQHFSSADEVPSGLRQRLEDVGELRLREMDEAGIDTGIDRLSLKETASHLKRTLQGSSLKSAI